MFGDPTREAARQIVEIIPLVMRTVGAHMRRSAHGVLPGHMRVLGMCAKHAHNLSDLAEAQSVSPPTMSRTVNTLVERGWLVRIPSEEDRRVVHIEVTPTGKQVLDEVRRQSETRVAEVVASLSPDELETMLAGLAVLREVFEAALQSEEDMV